MLLTNTQYNELMKRYDDVRMGHQRELSNRKEKIYAEIPEIESIDKTIASTSIRQGMLLIEGDKKALDELRISIEQLSNQKKQLLVAAGYPSDYLEPIYNCPICQDTGYTNDHKKCNCFVQASLDFLYDYSNLKHTIADENFDSFSLDYYDSKYIDESTGENALNLAKKAYEGCQSFVQNFYQKYDNLLLYGGTGLGKTFLSNCIAKEIMDQGSTVIYLSAQQLFEIMKKYQFDNDKSCYEKQQDIFTCDLLIIDDLGTEINSSVTVAQLFRCLNERAQRKKSTVISSNLGIKDIMERYTERNFSRIFSGYTIYKLSGTDIRFQKKQKFI